MSQAQPAANADTSGMQNVTTRLGALVHPELLGFSFHLAWLCLFMYNVVPGFVGREEGDYSALDPVYLYSMISLVVVLLFGIWKTRTFMSVVRSKLGCFGAPIVCALGTFFYTLCAMEVVVGSPTTPLLIAGGIMTGVGSAVMAAHWASVFGKAKARAVVMNFTFILAGVLIACLAISYLFPTLALIVATLLPLASGASLIYADKKTDTGEGSKDPQAKRQHSRRAYAILICAVALLGLSTGCLPQLGTDEMHFEQMFYSATSVIVLGAVGWLVAKEDRKALPVFFAAPLVVLVVFALPYVRFTSTDASGLFYAMGNATLELMLLFEAVLFALLFDFSCARTFMIARVTMAVSDLSGWFLASWIMTNRGTGGAMQVAGTAMLVGSEVIVGALIVTYLFLRKKSVKGPELNTQAAGVDARVKDSIDAASSKEDGTGTGSENQASRADDADIVAFAAERFGLSPREADVLRLLVAGESTAQIQDTLCIAPGTFNYHMRNIYTKLGVHSRQELLVFIFNQQEQQKQ